MSGEQRGVTLHQLLEQKKSFSPERCIELTIHFLQSLSAAHGSGKIFGAIYPDQILFQSTGEVQILELGAPRDPEDVTLTYLGFVPPELLEAPPGAPPLPTVEADLYSAGVVLFALLTSRVPFPGDGREKILESISQARMDTLPELKANLSHLTWILKKCLLRIPNRRFHTADEMLAEFSGLRPGRESRRSAAASAAPSTPGSPRTPRSKKQDFDIKSLWADYWKIIAPAGGGLVLLLLLIFLIMHHAGHNAPTRHAVRGGTIAPPAEWISETEPTLSPDGKQIAYISDLTGKADLYIRNIDDKKGTAITNSPGKEENPRWSPAGDAILYTYRDMGQAPALFSISPDGGIPQRIAGDAVDGQWSPDGKKICFVSVANEKQSLSVMGLDELQPKTILDNVKGIANPSFSGDGQEIVYEADLEKGHGLVKVEVQSGETKELTVGPYDSSPFWDGKAGVIYYCSKANGNSEIWSVDRDGTRKQITSGSNDFRPDVAFQKGSLAFYRIGILSDIFAFDMQRKISRNVSPQPGTSSFPLSVAGGRWLAFLQQSGDEMRLNWTSWNTSSTYTIIKQVPPGSNFSVSSDGSSLYWESPAKDLQQVVLTSGKAAGIGAAILLPYELSPNRKSLFLARKNGDNVDYFLKNMKDQQEELQFTLPATTRIVRASWNTQGKAIYFQTSDRHLSVFRIADKQSSILLGSCYDFSIKPKANTLAVLTGSDLKNARLVLLDPDSGKQTALMSFSGDGYAIHLDWSQDGSVIYYDRMKPGSKILLID